MKEKSEKSSLDSISSMFLAADFEPKDADEYKYAWEVKKDLHANYIMEALISMPHWYDRMDSGQPWFLFWVTNTLDLLSASENRYDLTLSIKQKIIGYLRVCWHPEGGFAGAPGLLKKKVISFFKEESVNCSVEHTSQFLTLSRLNVLTDLRFLQLFFFRYSSKVAECNNYYFVRALINGPPDWKPIYQKNIDERVIENQLRSFLEEAHVASTYAALNAIITVKLEEGYKLIDREKMLSYLLRLKHNWDTPLSSPSECSKARTTQPGSFQIHINGENDLRAVYCSLVVADVLNFLDNPELRKGIGDFISQCQTYEGGIACVPFGEAHAGYTYCGLASLILLGETHKINIDKLLEWTIHRQLEKEGGFNGRINKLVDSCYNFWLGSINELVDIVLKGKAHYRGEWLYNQRAVQGYTLLCCQSKKGGLLDKPGKNVDLYHTCYSLAGMSIAQSKSLYESLYEHHNFDEKNSISHSAILASHDPSKLSRTHPLYNVQHEKLLAAKKYFSSL